MTSTREIELAKSMWELEKKRKLLEKEVEDLKKEYSLKAEQLTEVLIEEGKSSTGKIDGVGEFKLKRESYPGVSKERLPAFIEYLKGIGHGGIVKEVVEANTLKSYLKTEIESRAARFADDPDLLEKTRLSFGLAEDIQPEELAAKELEAVGVKTFQQVKLSHTGKGRA